MDKKFVPVYYVSGQLEAEMICAFLGSFGIEAVHNQESVGVTYGLAIGPLGTAEIMVPEEVAEHAKELLKQMEQGDFDEKSSPEIDDENPEEPS
jgi:hypothetical protein